MKHWKLFALCLMVSSIGFGQSINYKIIKDQPEDAANFWINFGLMDFGLAMGNLEGYGMLGWSVNSVVNVKNKMGGEFTYRKFYFSIEEGKGRNFELGGYYNLFGKKKTKNMRVVLSSKSSSYGGKTYTETTSMKVPGTQMRSFGVRAGFNSQKDVIHGEMKTHEFDGARSFSSNGLYAGILLTKQVNLTTHTAEYGVRGFGLYRRTYIDLIFNPIKKLTDINTGTEFTDVKPSALGFRIGWEFMQPEPRKIQGNAIYQKIELGSRPLNGYYMMYSLGFNFKRKVKALSSFRPVREME
ncbi:MAG: hypothetical protein EP338_10310 [Bacteroidetes bacterium]|nr:MAG: hypothetical protein EP338_10310 [Bacteroidota bacterium]